jgi:hypothetical protein
LLPSIGINAEFWAQKTKHADLLFEFQQTLRNV